MTESKGKILAIDDNEDILFALKLLLKPHVEEIDTFNSPDNLLDQLRKKDYDLILLDMNFTKDAISGQEGFDWMGKILSIDPSAIIVFITAYGDAEKAVKSIKAGATDFVLKPWQNEKLLATVSSAIKLSQSKKENKELKIKHQEISAVMNRSFQEFIGESEEMKEVFATISKVAQTDANILILGENGTGKELVANAIHKSSFRKDEIFINVDLGSISETLFESELFGHEKGAFTDAIKERAGRFEIARGGSLFLDEIGNLSMPLQTKILTAIERREITRVGSSKPVSVDVRLICATNNNIHQMVSENTFRQDLLYRINTVEIQLPPLRERITDIPLLAKHFLTVYSKKYRKYIQKISPEAMKCLKNYSWPGNVRELQHSLERAVILTESNILQREDFMLSAKQGGNNQTDFSTLNLETIEKQVIEKALKTHSGNVTQASSELGLTRNALYRRMEKHGI
ncbi:MAG: sigma-54 dependent transcriptional regulator [Bacteroidota bacterium]|nr:sigma-54 dependent transcriptional regulator [Bacteroidota bacterium]